MKKLRFENLREGAIYRDRDGVRYYQFKGFRNDTLATFIEGEWVERYNGDFDIIFGTNEIYLTRLEIQYLIED